MIKHSILLLSGAPGIGKTTIIKRVVAKLGKVPLAGFYTEEIRERKQRVGFKLVGLRGPSGVIAHVNFDSPYRVGRYKIDVTAIDQLAAANLAQENAQAILIDEIGKMECLSQVFINQVRQLMDTNKPIIATIAKKGSGFIKEVKSCSCADLWEVTRGNRDALVQQVIDWLKQWGIQP